MDKLNFLSLSLSLSEGAGGSVGVQLFICQVVNDTGFIIRPEASYSPLGPALLTSTGVGCYLPVDHECAGYPTSPERHFTDFACASKEHQRVTLKHSAQIAVSLHKSASWFQCPHCRLPHFMA